MSALVGVIMGSKSDWSTLCHTVEMLDKLGIPNEVKVVSAHRTPDLLFQYAEQAEARGIQVIIAGAGGVGIGGRFFIGFLERCTQQARLILPCWGKSLVKEKEWWFRAGTAPPDPAAPSLHGRGVTAAIPSSPDVAESSRSRQGLRYRRPP